MDFEALDYAITAPQLSKDPRDLADLYGTTSLPIPSGWALRPSTAAKNAPKPPQEPHDGQAHGSRPPVDPEELTSIAALLAERDELRRHVEELRTSIEFMPHGFCMFDADARLVLSNARYAEMYGLADRDRVPGMSAEEIVRRRIARGMVPEGDIHSYMRRSLAAAECRAAQRTFIELSDGRAIATAINPLQSGGWVATHEDVTEQFQLQAALKRLAYEDTLTGLPNRIGMQQKLQQAIEDGEPFVLMCVDLEGFREVNVTFGQEQSDRILVEIARRLSALVPDEGTVSRLGHAEFAVLVPAAEVDDAGTLATQILSAVRRPVQIEGSKVQVGCNVGLAPWDGCGAERLTIQATLALEHAKTVGRHRFSLFEPAMYTAACDRRNLAADLRDAIETKQLTLVYQPIAKAPTGEVASFEALLRWNHPVRGAINPSEFIPVAEREGLMVRIGYWVLREACMACAAWPETIGVAVNFSATQFRSADVVDLVADTLADSGLAPSRLTIEITETSLLDGETTLDVLKRLRALGVGIAMDDFGTGYSSLSCLGQFPFSKVKVDRCFVMRAETSASARRMLEGMLAMAKALDLPSTVEGVETWGQWAAVTEVGCGEIQGFLFGRPMPPSDIPAWLARDEFGSQRRLARD